MRYAQEFAPTSAEKIGRNDATFRDANDGIAEVAEDTDFDDAIPFFCECAEPTCREIVRLSLEEYQQIRSDPRDFVNAVGHQAAARGWGEVIAETDGHVVVRKLGRAAEVATEIAEDDERV